jgi:type I restriction-modification system DNA methylase subunit
METKEFEKIKKKFALNNSYFKNRRPQDPATPLECLWYLNQHGELPYKEDLHKDWAYECFIEYQKRAGVVNDQYFTPPHVARDMVSVYFNHADINQDVTEPFCGYGQIANALFEKRDANNSYVKYIGIDVSSELLAFNSKQRQGIVNLHTEDVLSISDGLVQNTNFISNPPYSVKILTEFLKKLSVWIAPKNVAVLLLPQGFIHKKTKAIQEAMSKFEVIVENRYDSKTFAHTRVLTEIVVLKLKK